MHNAFRLTVRDWWQAGRTRRRRSRTTRRPSEPRESKRVEEWAMKRVLLIASALCIGIAAFVINTNPGITQAQTAARSRRPEQARPVPEASTVDQDAPYIEACAREGLSDSACVGPAHLVQGHRRQRSIPHLHLPAAHRRAGRLVPRAALGSARRPLRGVGHHQRSRLLQARRSGLSRQESRRDLSASTGVRATTCCSSMSASKGTSIRPAG